MESSLSLSLSNSDGRLRRPSRHSQAGDNGMANESNFRFRPPSSLSSPPLCLTVITHSFRIIIINLITLEISLISKIIIISLPLNQSKLRNNLRNNTHRNIGSSPYPQIINILVPILLLINGSPRRPPRKNPHISLEISVDFSHQLSAPSPLLLQTLLSLKVYEIFTHPFRISITKSSVQFIQFSSSRIPILKYSFLITHRHLFLLFISMANSGQFRHIQFITIKNNLLELSRRYL